MGRRRLETPHPSDLRRPPSPQGEGKGTYYFKDGDKYVGDLYDGRFCGYGVYYFKNGDRYEGQWKNDQRDGRGTYYYASGKRQTGTWSNGKFIG